MFFATHTVTVITEGSIAEYGLDAKVLPACKHLQPTERIMTGRLSRRDIHCKLHEGAANGVLRYAAPSSGFEEHG